MSSDSGYDMEPEPIVWDDDDKIDVEELTSTEMPRFIEGKLMIKGQLVKDAFAPENDDAEQPQPKTKGKKKMKTIEFNEQVKPTILKPESLKKSTKKSSEAKESKPKSGDKSKDKVNKPKKPKIKSNHDYKDNLPQRSSLMPIQINIQLSETPSEAIIEDINNSNNLFKAALDTTDVMFESFDWVQSEKFMNELEDFRVELKAHKIIMKGNIYVIVKHMDDGMMIVENAVIKTSACKCTFTPCSFNISVKAEKKDGAKKLTESEKLELFKEYYTESKELPQSNTVYKEFKVGQFYAGAIKNKTLVTQIEDIVKEVDDK